MRSYLSHEKRTIWCKNAVFEASIEVTYPVLAFFEKAGVCIKPGHSFT